MQRHITEGCTIKNIDKNMLAIDVRNLIDYTSLLKFRYNEVELYTEKELQVDLKEVVSYANKCLEDMEMEVV